MSRIAARDDQGRRRCTKCLEWKDEVANFRLQSNKRYREAECGQCRAARTVRVARERRKRLRDEAPPTFSSTPRMHDQLTDTELAYIAGLVDGEGCITSSLPADFHHPLRLTVAMVHRPTIELLHAKCGGVIGVRPKQANCRTAYHWIVSGRRAYSLLLRIAPFMCTKREEAMIACRIAATRWADDIVVGGDAGEGVRAERAALGQQLRDFKRVEWRA